MENDFDRLINSNKSRIEPFNLQFTPSSKRLPYLLFPSHVFKISNVWNKYLLLIDEFLLRLNLEKIRNINRINFFHLKIKSVNLLESSVIDFKFVKNWFCLQQHHPLRCGSAWAIASRLHGPPISTRPSSPFVSPFVCDMSIAMCTPS